MSATPLPNAIDEHFAKVESLRMLVSFLVGHALNTNPSFPDWVLQALDDAPPYLEPETVLSDPERSLKIRERAQALLRADMLQYVQARQQNRPPKDNQ